MKMRRKGRKTRPKSLRSFKNCALIPAYNEEKNIKEVVEKVKKMGILPIVIDDNSGDRTSEIAKKAGAIVSRHDSNMGKGEAIKTGIKYALKRLSNVKNFVIIDADMQYDPGEAPKLLDVLENTRTDIVVGFRDWSTVPFRHRLGNFVWRMSFNLLFGTNLKDTNCGIMAIKKNAAKKIISALHGGYIIENSILLHAVKKNLNIKQVPVTVMYKRKSDIRRGLRMVGGIFVFIVKEGLKYRFSKSKI